MINCKKCKTENTKDAKFCESCGELLKKDYSENLIECEDCGKKISKKAKFCPNCGVNFEDNKIDEKTTKGITKKKNPEVAAVLSVFFGPFGYLYTRSYGLFWIWLFVWVFFINAVKGSPIYFGLHIIFAIHNYFIAKEINEELKKNE